ncbi:putative holin-like toxin (plasmid) [Levilactobacillus brevis]|nr:putative holin-like toxin [Levilactobacillus brevis]MCB5233503.1 putative holin-like toxin [Levilactobacillus brevis]
MCICFKFCTRTLSLMLLFGTFLIALLSYIDKHHK